MQKSTLPLFHCEFFLVLSLNFQGLQWAAPRAVVWMWNEGGTPENEQVLHLSKQPRHTQLENGEQKDLAVAFMRVGQNLERVLFLLPKSLEFPALCPPTPCYSPLDLKLFCLSLAPFTPTIYICILGCYLLLFTSNLWTDILFAPMGLKKRLSLGILLGVKLERPQRICCCRWVLGDKYFV